MNKKKNKLKFDEITKDILEHEEFIKTKYEKHHGISRYEHLVRVSYYTYKITKLLRLNYVEATKGALLHDFFTDEVKHEGSVKRLRNHPNHALNNSKKHFDLTAMEKDIIKTHMFPVTFTPPKYLEGWIVVLMDNIAGIGEKTYSISRQLRPAAMLVMLFVFNFLRIP